MTPPYQIEALPAVDKDLDRLNPRIEQRIAGRISGLAGGKDAPMGHVTGKLQQRRVPGQPPSPARSAVLPL